MARSKLALAFALLCGLALCQLAAGAGVCKVIKAKPYKKAHYNVYTVPGWNFPSGLGCNNFPVLKVCGHDRVKFRDVASFHNVYVGPDQCKGGHVLVNNGGASKTKPFTSKPLSSYLPKGKKRGTFYLYCAVGEHCAAGMQIKVQVVC